MKKLLLFLIIVGGAVGFIFYSPMFERVPPTIHINSNGYTNLEDPLNITISDDSGIKNYTVTMLANNRVYELGKGSGISVALNLKLPKVEAKSAVIKVEAIDNSKWNFFAGNKATKTFNLIIDTTSPDAEIINNSYAIGRGGSAAVIVKVADDHLKDKYILVDEKYRFNLTPFYKDNYYVALIAWPCQEKIFNAQVVAVDKANNISKTHIPLYWNTRNRIYKLKHVKLKVSEKFIKNVAVRVLQKSHMRVPNDPIEAFKEENEDLRKMNEEELFDLTRNILDDKINSFSISRFNPLPGSAKKAGFMEFRHYLYKGEEISTACHKGVDLAKVKHAQIYSSNFGKVVAFKYLGIYGNTLVIYHKLGLYSTYSHLSETLVGEGEEVKKGEVIARTGSTGGVFGDHLHFGIYIQGYPVQPLEWMDKGWIKRNIIDVINSAKRIID